MRNIMKLIKTIEEVEMDYIFEDCVSGIIETATKVEVEKAFIDRITAFVSALENKSGYGNKAESYIRFRCMNKVV